MNNVQKAFKNKAKCGLRMAAGGMIDPSLVDQNAIKAGTVDPNGSDYDTINAEKTLRWAEEDARAAEKYGQPFQPTEAATSLVKGLSALPKPKPVAMQPVELDAEAPLHVKPTISRPTLRQLAGPAPSLADGGVIDPAEALLAKMKSKYGGVAAPQPPAPAPTPAPAPAPAPVQAATPAPLAGLRAYATGNNLDARMRAAGLAHGGIVHGKGGPTDDEVPMTVNGVDVNLSNKEAVLPAKTVDALGGPEAVEELIEKTNGKPVVKTGLRAGGDYSTGVVGDMIDPKQLRPEFRAQAQVPVIEPAANAGLEASRNARAATTMRAMPDVPNSGPQQLPSAAFDEEVRARAAANRAARMPPVAPAQGATAAAAPAAEAAATGGRMAGLRAFLTHPATVIPAAVQGTMAAANFVDSFPSLRGKATAADSNAELAGTPQHQAEVDAGLAARDAQWEKVHGQKLSDKAMAPGAAPKKTSLRFEDLPQSDPSYDKKEMRAASGGKQVQAEVIPDIKGLRAAGVTGGILGDVTENGKTPATGIRTIATPNGNVYAGRDKSGQLHVNFNSGMSATEADKARDAEFEAKGYGKDAYGNWMTPQRLGDKKALDTIERDRAKFAAFSDQITDPEARQAGLRRVMYDMTNDDLARKTAAENAKIKLDVAKYNQEERKMTNLQGNADREFSDKRAGSRDKVLNDWLDNNARVPGKDGKYEVDYTKRNELADALANIGGGQIPKDPDELQKHLTTYGNQSKLTSAMNNAVRNRGGLADFRNWFIRGKTTNQAAVPKLVGKTLLGDDLVALGDFRVPLREIVGDDADLLAEFKRRLADNK